MHLLLLLFHILLQMRPLQCKLACNNTPTLDQMNLSYIMIRQANGYKLRTPIWHALVSCFKNTDVQHNLRNLHCRASNIVEYKSTAKFPMQYHAALSPTPYLSMTQMKPLNHVPHIVLGRRFYMSSSLHIHTDNFIINLSSTVYNCHCEDHNPANAYHSLLFSLRPLY